MTSFCFADLSLTSSSLLLLVRRSSPALRGQLPRTRIYYFLLFPNLFVLHHPYREQGGTPCEREERRRSKTELCFSRVRSAKSSSDDGGGGESRTRVQRGNRLTSTEPSLIVLLFRLRSDKKRKRAVYNVLLLRPRIKVRSEYKGKRLRSEQDSYTRAKSSSAIWFKRRRKLARKKFRQV